VRIVFFGSPAAAIPSLAGVLEAGHFVELVVTQPDKPAGRGRILTPSVIKKFAFERGIPVLEPVRIRKDESAKQRILSIAADIHVVVAYGQIIPAEIIYAPRWHSINVHFSLLPKYRGASPVQWAILKGETRTGVTIFELNEKMDEGDILSAEPTDIWPRETAHDLETRLAGIGARLLSETLANIGSLGRIPQDHALATAASKLKKEDGRLGWADDAVALDRKIRAYHPWPGAFTAFKGKRIQVLRGRPLDSDSGESPPGTVLGVSKEGLDVACGGRGVFRIEVVRPEGRIEMSAYSFSLGAMASPGDVFSSPLPAGA
jgi:methionyl-tRNA formyltransferase